MNTVILSGRLTADIELRYIQSGAAVAQFNVAVSRKYKHNDEWKEEVSFIGVSVFGKQAETVAQYFKKGSPILVSGRLKQESWEKDGKKQSKTIVVMEGFEFMSQKSEAHSSTVKPPPARPTQESPTATATPTSSAPPPEEDDVPF